MPTFRRNGIELHYESAGAGQPVVLLHGFTSLGGTWQRHGWTDRLVAGGFRVVLLDARSHGQSSKVYKPAECETDVLAADVLGLLDHLGIGSAHVVGFSMGGGIAIAVAAVEPSRVRSLVISGVGDAAIDDLHDPHEIAAIADAFADPTTAVPTESQAYRLRRNAIGAGNDLAALLPFLQTGGWPGGLRAVSPLKMPGLVIVAERDEYMEKAHALLSGLRPTQVLRLPRKGHHHVIADDDVQRAVIAFLRAATWPNAGSPNATGAKSRDVRSLHRSVRTPNSCGRLNRD